jgi:hypothetical protein
MNALMEDQPRLYILAGESRDCLKKLKVFSIVRRAGLFTRLPSMGDQIAIAMENALGRTACHKENASGQGRPNLWGSRGERQCPSLSSGIGTMGTDERTM